MVDLNELCHAGHIIAFLDLFVKFYGLRRRLMRLFGWEQQNFRGQSLIIVKIDFDVDWFLLL